MMQRRTGWLYILMISVSSLVDQIQALVDHLNRTFSILAVRDQDHHHEVSFA